MVMESNIEQSISKSPLKPKLLLKKLNTLGIFDQCMDLKTNFRPFEKSQFLIAHTQEYVDAFFSGNPPCESNGLPWSEELVTSVCWTNSSLYHAMEYAYNNPGEITFSPTSGFHHAEPTQGFGFCSFSGQIISSVLLFRKFGIKTAWLDLDGHFGNSIEDGRDFVSDLNFAVPIGFNINPSGKHKDYIKSLIMYLQILEEAILNNEIDCVVWCHGADSHEDDDFSGGQCTTAEWIECSKLFYTWINELNIKRGKPLPVTLTLFGGYRSMHDFSSVLSLHTADIVQCLNILCEGNIGYIPEVKRSSFRSGF